MSGELKLSVVYRQMGEFLGVVLTPKCCDAANRRHSMTISGVERQTPKDVGAAHRSMEPNNLVEVDEDEKEVTKTKYRILKS